MQRACKKMWRQLTGRKAPPDFIRMWRHHCSRHAKSHGSGFRSRFLLYGALAFMWERERISEEDVMSCVRGCVGRAPVRAASSSSQDPSAAIHRTTSTAPKSAPDSPTQATTGLLTQLYEKAYSRFTPATTDKADTLPWSHQISGWLPWSNGDGSGWFSRGPPADSDSGVISDSNSIPCEEISETATNEPSEFVRESLRVYRAHSEDRISQLPLVGITKEGGRGRRPLRQGMRALERVKERTQAKVVSVLGYHLSHLDSQRDDFVEGSAACDLACIDADLKSGGSHAVPSLYSGNWVSCYMQVEHGEEAEIPVLPSSVDQWEPYNNIMEHPVLLRAFQPILDSMKLLVNLGQEHLKDNLLLDGAFLVDQQVPVSLREAALDLKEGARSVWSMVLERYLDGSVANRGSRTSSRTGVNNSTEGQMLSSTGSVVTCVDDGTDLELPGPTLPDLTPLVRKNLADGRAACFVEDPSQTAELSGWDVIGGEQGYTAYRKPYKNTGLFQYKVIGHYDDITAKDFHETQEDHAFRKTWDDYAGDLATLDTDTQSGSSLVHWVMKYPFPMSNREYVFVQRSWVSAKRDMIVTIKRSTSHPDVPEGSGTVRVKDYFSEMVIRAHSTVDRPGMDFELTYFDNPQTQLPSSCVNWVTSTAMPDFMSKIHTAALTRRR